MPLRDILADVAAITGTRITDVAQRDMLVSEINNSARELYNAHDLVWSEREQLFNIGQSDQQIALPYYVDKLIYARHYTFEMPVTMQDMRPRYRTKNWSPPYLRWRIKERSPLMSNIIDVAPFAIVLADPATVQFTVTFTGATDKAARIVESVLFNVGDVAKTTINSFIGLESIRKSANTNVDVAVYDINDRLISVIPNVEPEARYLMVQVLDNKMIQEGDDRPIECLYKTRFSPFYNDDDNFPCGEIYDHAILWNTLSHIWSTLDGQQDKALMAEKKAKDIVNEIAAKYKEQQVVKPAMEPQAYYGLFGRPYMRQNVTGPWYPRYMNTN